MQFSNFKIRYDEYGNYYNKDGVPEEVSFEDEEEEEEEEFKIEKEVNPKPNEKDKKGDYENYDDELIKEYEIGFKENEDIKEDPHIIDELCKISF